MEVEIGKLNSKHEEIYPFSWGYSLKDKGGYAKLHLCGSFLGCGIMELNGITHFSKSSNEEIKDLLKVAKKQARLDGAGAIVVVLGKSWFKAWHKRVLELGFRHLSTYDNPTHHETYMQRLYILKTK